MVTAALLAVVVSAAANDAPRARLAVGPWLGLAAGSVMSFAPGATVSAGVQIDDHWAVFVDLRGGTLLIASMGTASLMGDLSLAHGRVSLGLGLGVSAAKPGTLCLYGTCPSKATVSAGVPLRLAINAGDHPGDGGGRRRFFVAFDGYVGVTLDEAHEPQSRLTGSGGLSFGFQLM